MSVDLISREATMKMLREYAEVKFACGQIELANGILKAVNYIENDNIPAAYDVDEVVEQIREYADNVAELGGNFLPKVVIEIVKGGGLDDGK